MSEGQRASSVDEPELSQQLPGSEWRDLANCRDFEDPSLFFPPGPSEEYRPQIDAAKAICALCVVQAECLDYALETNQKEGIWSGLVQDDLKRHRRRWLADKRRDR